MTELDALTAIITRCPNLLRQATDTLRAWRANSPIRDQRLARAITDALRHYGDEFSPEERGAMLALLPAPADSGDNRTLDVRLRVTPTEKAQIQAAADAAGVSMSDYIRQRIGL